MTPSTARISANRINAQKSTGAITQTGKNKVSMNAVTHGLFSKKIVLDTENPLEYQSLLNQLKSELFPVGILEESLVERISVSLWRQKRLVKAETAYINLECQSKKIANVVEHEIYPSYHSGRAISELDLVEIDYEHLQRCQAILDEHHDLGSSIPSTVDEVEKDLPQMYRHLLQDANGNNITPEQYLQHYTALSDYFAVVVRYCREQLQEAKQKELILDVAELIRNKRAILPEKARESLAKYQVMLDNELYKAIKALREAQEWRLKFIPSVNDIGFMVN
jgi:hypothetical protein